MNLKSLRLLHPQKIVHFFRISEPPVKRPVGNLAMPMLQVKWTAVSILHTTYRERWNLPHSIFSLRPRTKVDATLVAPMHDRWVFDQNWPKQRKHAIGQEAIKYDERIERKPLLGCFLGSLIIVLHAKWNLVHFFFKQHQC